MDKNSAVKDSMFLFLTPPHYVVITPSPPPCLYVPYSVSRSLFYFYSNYFIASPLSLLATCWPLTWNTFLSLNSTIPLSISLSLSLLSLIFSLLSIYILSLSLLSLIRSTLNVLRYLLHYIFLAPPQYSYSYPLLVILTYYIFLDIIYMLSPAPVSPFSFAFIWSTHYPQICLVCSDFSVSYLLYSDWSNHYPLFWIRYLIIDWVGLDFLISPWLSLLLSALSFVPLHLII